VIGPWENSISPEQAKILGEQGTLPGNSGKSYEVGNVPRELFLAAAQASIYLDVKGTRYSWYDDVSDTDYLPLIIEEVTPQQ
jgi:hypothetical protein